MTALDADELGWRDAEKAVRRRAADVEASRLPPLPEIAPPPEDVEYEYEQLWQVRALTRRSRVARQTRARASLSSWGRC